MINIAIKLATSITYTADGSQTNFSIPFDYLRPSFVHVAVNDAEVSEGFTVSNRMVMFDVAPAKDTTVHIYRSTPTTRLVSWADASILKAIDMTIAEVQQLHILEEASDWSKTNSIVLDEESGTWQGRKCRMSNIADPVDAQDVVTKHYLEDTEDSFVQHMNAIKTQTEQFANTAGNSKDNAYKSAQSASTSAANAAESARLAEDYKNVAETAKNNASLYAINAKTSADNASASKETAQSAATTASNFATDARSSAGEAKTYRDAASIYNDNAKTYMDNAKNYSENVNVFTPSVSSDGVLSWTNKAGLTNPASVNIKGAKGDQGLQGVQGVQGVKGEKGDTGARGATGAAASIRIGTVTTGAAGSNASVTNSGTASDVVLDFTLPRGNDGKDGGITVDSKLSNTSTNPVQNKVIKAELDNKMAKGAKIYEAKLAWGGRNIADGYSPTDAGMIAELGANRFEFGKIEGVTVEYSEDAGATWNKYSAEDDALKSLFSVMTNSFYAGGDKSRLPSINDMLRVTIDVNAFQVYTALNKFGLYISTGGARGCYCTIEASLENNPTAFEMFADRAPISGWSGYNIINTSVMETYSNQPARQYGLIRFTFGSTSAPTNPDYKGLAVLKIMGFGGAGWNTPSNMAKNGHLYSYNRWQDAEFPAAVTATNFIGNVNGHTIESSVPANAKFIDPETANTWTGRQTFNESILKDTKLTRAIIYREIYQSEYGSGDAVIPSKSTMCYTATGATTLDMTDLVDNLLSGNKTTTVFTAYITADADYALTILNAGTIKYIGSASDVAITSAGLLLNIMLMKDASGNVTSIVQASKLS